MVGVLFLYPTDHGRIFARPIPMNCVFRNFLVLAVLVGNFGPCIAQVISGTLERPLQAHVMLLYGTRGEDHPAIDSVSIDADGYFTFPQGTYPPGFYQLGVNDTDRVDIILDPYEARANFRFHGSPLQQNIEVVESSENQRMWAYKARSRNGQDVISAIRLERATASPLDTGLLRNLDEREREARRILDHALDSLTEIRPQGQFAFAVAIDKRLDEVRSLGPAATLRTFNFSDPRLLRSASYTKALVQYLQSTPYTDEFALHRACDSLLTAASGDTSCWSYMRKHLVELFATYGPDDVAQHLVERYVVGDGVRSPPDAELLRIAAAQLRSAPGAPAPDMILVSPGKPDTLHLLEVVLDHTYTGLFFYSSTCDHCHDQMPGLRQLVVDMDPKYFHLVGIALDATAEEFAKTIAEEDLNWPCYTELKGWGVQGAKDFNVKATPTLIVLDREGRIANKPMDHEQLRAFLQAQLHR